MSVRSTIEKIVNSAVSAAKSKEKFCPAVCSRLLLVPDPRLFHRPFVQVGLLFPRQPQNRDFEDPRYALRQPMNASGMAVTDDPPVSPFTTGRRLCHRRFIGRETREILPATNTCRILLRPSSRSMKSALSASTGFCGTTTWTAAVCTRALRGCAAGTAVMITCYPFRANGANFCRPAILLTKYNKKNNIRRLN